MTWTPTAGSSRRRAPAAPNVHDAWPSVRALRAGRAVKRRRSSDGRSAKANAWAGTHCSLQITLAPAAPRAFPACRFMGADVAINPLKAALNRNLATWDSAVLPRLNLEVVPCSLQEKGGKER